MLYFLSRFLCLAACTSMGREFFYLYGIRDKIKGKRYWYSILKVNKHFGNTYVCLGGDRVENMSILFINRNYSI